MLMDHITVIGRLIRTVSRNCYKRYDNIRRPENLHSGRVLLRGKNHTDLSNNINNNNKINNKIKILPKNLISTASHYASKLSVLEDSLSKGQGFNVESQREFSKLSLINGALNDYKSMLDDIEELQNLIETDLTLRCEATEELNKLIPDFNHCSDKLLEYLIPPHPFAEKACLIELHPGVGGVEAMNFTQDLFNMYMGYINKNKWRSHVISKQKNESGSGLVNAIISVDELGSYNTLRHEAGVHRVQRVPDTETKGRTHTSTAAVIVLPQMGDDSDKAMDAYESTFKPDEIRIDVKRASGKGGQHVNTTDSAVRLTHIPTGIVVSMQDERSQLKNKAKAFAILRARLAERERKEKEEKERAVRKEQVTTTDRSDKIRTYNYPQNRVTDHRCSFSIHDIEGIVSGERLQEIIDAVNTFDIQQKSKNLLEPEENSTL